MHQKETQVKKVQQVLHQLMLINVSFVFQKVKRKVPNKLGLAERAERANLSAFGTFVRFVLVWICRFPWGLGRAAVCDCGTPWTFLLLFFFYYNVQKKLSSQK